MSIQAEQFTVASLPEAERREAKALATDVRAAIVKGLLHRGDSGFALTGDVRGIETQAAVAVQAIDAGTFELIRPRLARAAASASAFERLTGRSIEALRKPDAITWRPKVAKPALTPPAQSKYRRLDLNIRKLHCVDETGSSGPGEWGADEMLLGAVRVGASGNVDYTKAIIAGDYDDGTVRSFGELPFGSVSMRTTPGFPKTFYWVFQLVETDSDEGKTAKAITAALSTVVKVVGTATGNAPAGVVAGAVLDAIGGLIDVLVDEDHFSPFGVAIRLDGDQQFGSDGVQDEHTGNISAHQGTYRIGYRLRLVV